MFLEERPRISMEIQVCALDDEAIPQEDSVTYGLLELCLGKETADSLSVSYETR